MLRDNLLSSTVKQFCLRISAGGLSYSNLGNIRTCTCTIFGRRIRTFYNRFPAKRIWCIAIMLDTLPPNGRYICAVGMFLSGRHIPRFHSETLKLGRYFTPLADWDGITQVKSTQPFDYSVLR